ncbi:uncharacterized protein K489DRAFT_412246 [Dissoconium aciculare CBS 342.82]|uniref:Uncharacterized protein n=1 Tax=Dissoconium aciculare CBS 342.82 TaxID=1314786 RepID=A0A6J3LX81_9PEZI|nr:uncharacterized protein K489DRAFT_412246 [Dissoconium aciculare CBS 342.82]KAF1820273.1 hypothetical protein K489DRAFT_412246 [Dissoconium aciculare CBS 342.82]
MADALLASTPARSGEIWTVGKMRLTSREALTSNKGVFDASTKARIHNGFWVGALTCKGRKIKAVDRWLYIPSALLPPEEDIAQDAADQVAVIVCELLSKCPETAVRPGVVLAQLLVSIAVQRYFENTRPISFYVDRDMTVFKQNFGFSIAWDVERGDRYFAKVLALDSELFLFTKNEAIKVWVPLGDIDLDVNIPTIPLSNLPDVEYGTRGPNINTLSPKDKLTHEKAIELCHYVQYAMYGAVGDRDYLQAQANSIAAVYCRGGNRTLGKSLKGIYDHRSVYAVTKKKERGRIDIEQSIPTEKDVGTISGDQGKRHKLLPAIQIIGYSRGRTSVVLEELVTALLDGNCNLLQAWEMACLKADSVNVTHDRSFITHCDHTDEERCCHLHVCQGCFTLPFCRDMQMHPLVLRVCLACVSKVLPVEIAGFSATGQPHSSTATAGYHGRLLIVLRAEESNLTKRRGIAKEQDDKWRNIDGWEDQFIDVRRFDVLPLATATRTSPFLASPDAATIFHVEDGKTSYHHSGNVVPTAAWANQASHTYLKGVLQVASDFLSKPVAEHHQLNVRMDHLFAIRQKFPWYRTARLDIKMSPEEFDSAREEWRNGVYRKPDEVVYYNIHFASLKQAKWDKKRMRELTDAILDFAPASEKWPNVEMPRGSDGAPFPWRRDHKPDDWSWEYLEGCMMYHYNLMWFWCNKDFITEETPTSLCFELIWQWRINAGRCAYLGIPLTLYSHHPSEFAIGHEHHGRAMRTAWPNADTITDMDYAESDYDQMRNELQTRCRDQTEWFVRPKDALPSLVFERSLPKALQVAKRFVTKLADDDMDDVREVHVNELEDDIGDTLDEDVGADRDDGDDE